MPARSKGSEGASVTVAPSKAYTLLMVVSPPTLPPMEYRLPPSVTTSGL